ncbi:roundabout homolog 1-like [Elysia marginata]|uniref:Roundabout homolog 1-like n=1 Tax=Elysia marginata TaxID=1093978 RepID=A0AAV4G2Q5_9GAST|nr:roundabout homolog 1-like [Elysia marginata]
MFPDKAAGTDNIKPRLLKTCSIQLASIFTFFSIVSCYINHTVVFQTPKNRTGAEETVPRKGGNGVRVNNNPVYSHTPIPATVTTPVYFRSRCSVIVPVEDLGKGTHSFLGFPQVSQSCTTNIEQGYFIGKSARCTCRATSDGYPRGSSQWYKGDQPVGTNGDLDITYNKNNPEQVYTCEAMSTLGRKPGSTLRAKFACPPQVTVGGQTYRGISPSNIVTLAEGYTGDVTCRVEEGYPGAHTTQLKCGQLENTGDGNTATVRFTTDTLTRDLDGTECTCTSQHDSGCYNNKEARFKLNVTCLRVHSLGLTVVMVTTTKVGSLSVQMLVVSTRERNDDIIKSVQTAQLTHALDSLKCLDTGVYVCSGQNSQGITSEKIRISVNCAQQFSPLFSPSPKVDGVLGETAEIDIEIYGFPEPSVTLHRTVDNANLKSFPRHEVKYTSSVAPFGFVNVTISDLVKADYTTYTLTIDNGVGDALVYSFYLNQVKTQPRPEAGGGDTDAESGSFNSTALIIGLVAVVILGICVVIIVFLVRKNQDMKKRLDNDKENAGTYMVPVERPDIVNTLQTPETPRPGHYEDIDGIHNATYAPPVLTSSPPLSRPGQNITETSADTHTTLVSASQPPGNAQYETIPDMVQQSGLYSSTSPQDVEPPNIYRRYKPDTSSNTDVAVSGTYNNYVPGYHGETPDTGPRSQPSETPVTSLPATNYVNVELPSVAGNTSNRKLHQQAYENVYMS